MIENMVLSFRRSFSSSVANETYFRIPNPNIKPPNVNPNIPTKNLGFGDDVGVIADKSTVLMDK